MAYPIFELMKRRFVPGRPFFFPSLHLEHILSPVLLIMMNFFGGVTDDYALRICCIPIVLLLQRTQLSLVDLNGLFIVFVNFLDGDLDGEATAHLFEHVEDFGALGELGVLEGT